MDLKWAELVSPNPGPFTTVFQWRFRLESFLPTAVPLTLGFAWVGSAKSSEYDIVLDEFEIDGIAPGANEFTVEHPPPDIDRIPRDELFGMTVMTITFSIAGEPFLRIAYLVSVGAFGELSDAIASGNSQPPQIKDRNDEKAAILQVLGRNVVADKPRLHVFPVTNWAGYVAGPDGSFRLAAAGTNGSAVGEDGAAQMQMQKTVQTNQPVTED